MERSGQRRIEGHPFTRFQSQLCHIPGGAIAIGYARIGGDMHLDQALKRLSA
jgi:hypothetical protein